MKKSEVKKEKATMSWQERCRTESGWYAKGLEGVQEAQDSYTGRKTREFLVKYTTVKENETPKMVTNQLGDVRIKDFLVLNNTRFFAGALKATSKLRKGTKLLIPTAAQGERGEFTDGEVRATNYQIWLVEHVDGELTELIASEVQEAVWCYRRISEGWTIATDAPHMGARVRRVFPEQKDPNNPDQPYSVNGTVVGYLPPGESEDDFALWHMVHDGGDDDEDLEAAEVEEGIQCYEEFQSRPAAPVKPTAAPTLDSKQERAAAKDAAAAGKAKTKTRRKDKNAPKGPRMPFLFFYSKVRTDMIKEDPNTTFGATGKRAGQLWRELDAEAKAVYVKMHEEDKLRYQKEMKDYVPPVDPAPSQKRQRGKAAGSSSSSESDSESSSESESESESSSESDLDSESDEESADGEGSPKATLQPKPYDAEWAELDDKQRGAAAVLGYAEQQWQGKEVPPGCVGSQWETDPEVVRTWEELTPEQLEAARLLGYEKWEWDNAMRDGVLPADNASTSMFLVGEECFAFDAEGKAYQAVVKKTRRTTAPYVSSPSKRTMGVASPGPKNPPGQAAADTKEQDFTGDTVQKAKVKPSRRWEYFIHYKGWKSKWDVWMTNESIFKKNPENAKLCTSQGEVSKGPSGFSKKEKEAQKAKLKAKAQAKKQKERRAQQRAKEKALKAAKREAKKAKREAKKAKKAAKAAKAKGKTAKVNTTRASSKAHAKSASGRAAKRKLSGEGLAGNDGTKPKRIRPPKVTEDRVRRNSSEAQAARQVQQTALPEILQIQLSQDYKACHDEQKVVALPRKPCVAQVLEEFTTAKLKSIQSKLSKEHRTGGGGPDLSTARSTLLVGTGAAGKIKTSPSGAKESSASTASPDGAQQGQDAAEVGQSVLVSKKGMTSMYWSEAEDKQLLSMVEKEGANEWHSKAERLGTKRSGEAVYKHYKILKANLGLTEGNFGISPKAPPKKLSREPDAKALAATVMDANELAQHREQSKRMLAPWEELCRGLREFFNAALLPFLLFESEREQAVELRRLYPESADCDFASLYGPEHMLRLLVQLPELIAGVPSEQRQDTVSRIYGQHGFTRWFERHYYDWFHDPEGSYVVGQNPSPTAIDVAANTAEDTADGNDGTAAVEAANGDSGSEEHTLVRYGVRPPTPPPGPKLSTWKQPSATVVASSPGIPIQESAASVKHSKLLSRLLRSPETVGSDPTTAAAAASTGGEKPKLTLEKEAAEAIKLKADFRAAMREQNMRPEVVSEAMGFSRTTLTNWLSGVMRDADGRVTKSVEKWMSQLL